jgi:hypothetical protein
MAIVFACLGSLSKPKILTKLKKIRMFSKDYVMEASISSTCST